MLFKVRSQKLFSTVLAASPAILSLRGLSQKKCVIYHTGNVNPYENLAFEQWLYENESFVEKDGLFVWRNEPCVVIGRHQNPWKETHVPLLNKDNVKLCRRSSGGGAVYHDLGNVNFTFFTDRASYVRKPNLQTIVDGILNKWPHTDLSINCRHDIMLKEIFKISGSSAKLGPKTAYHHCTLLVNSDKDNLLKYLTSKPFSFHCKSTESIRSSVSNLCDENPLISFEDVRNCVSESYASKHVESQVFAVEDMYKDPVVQKISSTLQEWDWQFGKTPYFSIEKEFFSDKLGLIAILVSIKHGIIDDISIKSTKLNADITRDFSELLVGVRFSYSDVFSVMKDNEFGINPLKQFNFLSKAVMQFLC